MTCHILVHDTTLQNPHFNNYCSLIVMITCTRLKTFVYQLMQSSEILCLPNSLLKDDTRRPTLYRMDYE